MKFLLKNEKINKQSLDCIVAGVFEQSLSPAAKYLDDLSKGFLSRLIKKGDFQGKIDQTLMLFDVPHIPFERILLVGCGKEEKLTERSYRKIIAASARALKNSKAIKAGTTLAELKVNEKELMWKLKQIVLVTQECLYSFNQFKSEKPPAPLLKEITLFVSEKADMKQAQKIVTQNEIIAESISYTKNLENLPSNICTPPYLAQQAAQLAKENKLSIKILEEKDMKKLGMNALLAVSKGSKEPPKLVCLEYKGSKEAPIAFVGKGITFDTGGISLKPSDSMVGMKYDMCGAACILGIMQAVARLKLPLHLVGILAIAENMPDGGAGKPEDIVTTLSGQTVEILNTDAEGRLVLSDALTYCERYKPSVVIDIATLTGAVLVALGTHASGLLSNNDALAKELLAAGEQSYDRAWQLPLWDEYQDQIKSPFADMANVGGKTAGAITAACFLSRFTKKFTWAHLDVAGTAAMMFGSDRYATGRPIPMLMQFLLNRCDK